MQSPILCIPRLPINITREYITDIIHKMNIGGIQTLHEIPLQNSNQFKRVIIRIDWDLRSPEAIRIYSTLSENKSIKIVHSMPWYWVCVKYTKQGTKEIKTGLDPSLIKLLHSHSS